MTNQSKIDPRNHKLRAVREANRMSQIQLAALAKVTPAKVSILEAGCRCDKSTARRIAEALNVEPVEVFENFDELRGS